jgi:hypothetical protein
MKFDFVVLESLFDFELIQAAIVAIPTNTLPAAIKIIGSTSTMMN